MSEIKTLTVKEIHLVSSFHIICLYKYTEELISFTFLKKSFSLKVYFVVALCLTVHGFCLYFESTDRKPWYPYFLDGFSPARV